MPSTLEGSFGHCDHCKVVFRRSKVSLYPSFVLQRCSLSLSWSLGSGQTLREHASSALPQTGATACSCLHILRRRQFLQRIVQLASFLLAFRKLIDRPSPPRLSLTNHHKLWCLNAEAYEAYKRRKHINTNMPIEDQGQGRLIGRFTPSPVHLRMFHRQSLCGY